MDKYFMSLSCLDWLICKKNNLNQIKIDTFVFITPNEYFFYVGTHLFLLFQ